MSSINKHINQTFKDSTPSSLIGGTLLTAAGVCALIKIIKAVKKHGAYKVFVGGMFSVLKSSPVGKGLVKAETEKTLKKIESMMALPNEFGDAQLSSIPPVGYARDDVLRIVSRWHEAEGLKWQQGQVSGGIYHGDKELTQLLVQVYGLFAVTNPLHPDVFPYIRKMECEIVRMTVDLFNGRTDECGTMTSGGTESILMAMKSYRDRGRERGIETAEIIAAVTAHAAFDKAAHYFDMKLVHVPVDPVTFEVDIDAVRRAITKNTVVIVGSAPQFPHGIIDPIEKLAVIAKKHGVGLHVDGCLGGYLLPFVEKLGYKLPLFDFRVDGVTSISADTHKYGYAPKGSSVIMYKSPELRHYQYFVAPEWPGGIYASPSMPGSRPGGLVAGTWAALVSMGQNGYLACAKEIMNAAKQIEAGIRAMDGLRVLGQPQLSVVAFSTDTNSKRGAQLNIFKVGEAMGNKGWVLNTLKKPGAIHICCTYMHRDQWKRFLDDLQFAVEHVLANPQLYKNGTAAIYGMAESVPDDSILEDMAKGYIDALYKQ